MVLRVLVSGVVVSIFYLEPLISGGSIMYLKLRFKVKDIAYANVKKKGEKYEFGTLIS